jgi:hypothetical protein
MKELDEVKKMLKTQGECGNWNYDPYMHGMFNGLELAIATIEGREPETREAPNEWLFDKNTESGISPENAQDETRHEKD